MARPDDLRGGAVDLLPVGVVVLGADGRVLVWNATAERLTGWPSAIVLGSRVADSTALDGPTAARVLEEIRAGRTFSGRLPADPPTGRSLYFRAAPGPAGELVGVLQDVGDTLAEDEAFALLDTLWETAPVGLAYFDTAMRYRRVNAAVLAADGGTCEDRIGHTPEQVHGGVGATITAVLEQVLAEGRARLDVPVRGRLWHGIGPLREWRVYGYPVRLRGAVVGVGVALVDVTAAEDARRELAALVAEREHTLGRYQSLVAATSAAVWTRAADGRAIEDAPALRAITGQTAAEHTGWGWVAAVHPAHREALAATWRSAAAAVAPDPFTRDYRLRTTAGYRWFRTRAVPVRAGGRVVEWVGTETDVDVEVRAEHRLAVLGGATAAMRAALEPEGQLAALVEAVVPAFADFCRVYLLDPAPRRRPRTIVTGRRGVTGTARGVSPPPPKEERFALDVPHPVAECVRAGAPVLLDVSRMPDTTWAGGARTTAWGAAMRASSALAAPVFADGTVLAVVLMVACGDRPAYTEDDRHLAVEIAERVSSAVEAGRAYQRSRRVSVALQAAMLSNPPAYPGLEVVGRYQPAAAEMAVGGDWYDAFVLPGGDLAVGVGDVVGHDLTAAVAMGQLRSMLRALAHDGEAVASNVVARLDAVATGLGVTRLASLIYGRLRGGCFRWSNAGHPPPLLVPPDGAPRLLGGVDLVLGVRAETARTDHQIDLPPGSTLLLYTDGLVERRGGVDDAGGVELLNRARAAAGRPLAEFCDHVLAGVADVADDIALLAVRRMP